MTPLFFGDSQSPLFGVLNEPTAAGARGHGVLLCPPIGQEHVRTHWAMRQVALSLGRAGFHCLRFDWFGVGDSSGDLASATLARWTEDAVQAAQELRDAAGVRKVSIVGLRLGATIAAMAARRIAPSTIVLWDPVIEGAHYLRELRDVHDALITDARRYWNPRPRETTSATELVGFELGDALSREIATIHVAMVADLPAVRIRLLRSSPSTDFEKLETLLRDMKQDVEVAQTEMRAKWTSPDDVEELLLAADAVRAVSSFMADRPAGAEVRVG